MRKLIPLLFFFYLMGCAGMLPHSKPAATYDDIKKVWTITSTRWGNDYTNLGRNPSFIRAFVYEDGRVSAHVYVTLETSKLMRPEYALNSAGKRYDVVDLSSEVKCYSSGGCTWYQDIVVQVGYEEMLQLLGTNEAFKLRIYGPLPYEDVLVLSCQYWEVINEIGKIIIINPEHMTWYMSGRPCTSP